ncbi:arginine--tRNA ligase, partial [Patescibacteria group bacterium]|nr:arginine--tRNA ligase [Patescibacteria group bacterium]
MLKQRILEDLQEAVKDLGYPVNDIVLSIPKNSAFGDYTTNIALQLAKLKSADSKQSPTEIANEILQKIGKLDYLEKAEIAGGGFINFFISDEVLLKKLFKISSDKEQAKLVINDKNKEKKVMVEFAHPNTHKAFHIGHLRNISTGESVVRMLEAVGYQVIRANYEGDVGMHIAKAIYALLHISPFKEEIDNVKGIWVGKFHH